MSIQLLKGKKGIIFGALDHNSIAWKVAEKAHEHGAKIVLTNAPIALRKGDIFDLGKKINAEVISADITQVDELDHLFQESMNIFGGKIDFVLHSVGMSPNVRKGLSYTDLDYNYLNKTLDVSAISFHKVLQVAYKLDAINDWGSILALSYIAAQRTYSTYSDMAQAKAMLESIARSFGYHYGVKRKVRINTISQSPTITTAGTGVGGFKSFYAYAHCMSPLGNATSDDCAEFCIVMFSDLTKKVTMQNIFHDGGYSTMGISDKLIQSCFTCQGECFDDIVEKEKVMKKKQNPS
ncbi:MAG TPA: SDR family oxidoreductase [Bacteroidales bacterium]|nr:SDR family oxidoreductase [Bacteroidales bacterium]